MTHRDRMVKINKVRGHFNAVQTEEQRRLLADWSKKPFHGYGIYWNLDQQSTELSTAYLDLRNIKVPFDENSTTEDVQTFIDLLKVADIHEG